MTPLEDDLARFLADALVADVKAFSPACQHRVVRVIFPEPPATEMRYVCRACQAPVTFGGSTLAALFND